MESPCDFCGEERSMLYCRADAARLCLSCDRYVHAANALSRRHLRTLLCDGCNSQPATLRCLVDNISLCPDCDRNTHGKSPIALQHKRHTIECFMGCPSAAELARIWSCDLNNSSNIRSATVASTSYLLCGAAGLAGRALSSIQPAEEASDSWTADTVETDGLLDCIVGNNINSKMADASWMLPSISRATLEKGSTVHSGNTSSYSHTPSIGSSHLSKVRVPASDHLRMLKIPLMVKNWS